MSGWGCDPATGALTAPGEVWEQEIKACPQAWEFRMGTLPHCFELREIFEGITASGDFAVYPGTLTGERSINFGSIPSMTVSEKRVGEASKKSASKKALQLDRVDTALQLATKMLSSGVEEESESVVQQAARKLRENYRGKEGWNSEDFLDGYELFESTVKAEVFLALDGEVEAAWLRRQIIRYRATF